MMWSSINALMRLGVIPVALLWSCRSSVAPQYTDLPDLVRPEGCRAKLHVYGSGAEYRLGTSAKTYSALREEDACERYWHALHARGRPTTKLVTHDLTGRRAVAEVQADDDVQLYVEVEVGGVIKRDLEPTADRRMPGSASSYSGTGWKRAKFKERVSIYRRVLTGSSTVALPVGTHYFAVSRAGKPLSEVTTPLEIRDALVVRADITANSKQRRNALWFIGGGLGVALLGGVPLAGGIASDSTVLVALGGVGIVTGVLTAGFGVAAHLLSADEGTLVRVPEP